MSKNHLLSLRSLLLVTLLTGLQACSSLTPATPHESTNRKTLQSLIASVSAPKVTVEANARSYHIGDPIRFRVRSNSDGLLWVVAINADDSPVILYPNEGMPDNRIRAGAATDIPSPALNRELRATAPAGQTTLGFFVLPEGQSLDSLLTIRDQKLLKTGFASDRRWGMAKLEIDVAN